MSRRFRLVVVILALAASGLTAARAQQPQSADAPPVPTFRAQVEYVEVDALVADESGNVVRDLRKEDFEVVEDGKVQTISAFSFVDLPIERADRPSFAAGPVERDVQSNARPFDGRIYAIVLDDLHVDVARSAQVRLAARQFIERNLGVNDLAAVTFTGQTEATQELTSNRRLLLSAIDSFIGSRALGSTLTNNEIARQRIDIPTPTAWPIDEMNDSVRGSNAQSMLRTLRQVSAWLGGIHGRRKSLLLFSEGIDYDLSDQIRGPLERPSPAGAILARVLDTLATTARSNVSIYAIDPRGLTGVADAAISGFADQGQGQPFGGIGLGSLSRELQVSQQNLRQLADESGGFAAVNRNDLTGVFDRIVRDNSSYYVLAYYPPPANPDGRLHSIEVNLKRAGLTVRARRGYVTPRAAPAASTRTTPDTSVRKPGVPTELSDAMNSLLPVSGLTMQVFAAPFKGSKRNASVMIGIEVAGDGLGSDSDSKLDLSFMAVDRNAKVFGARYDSMPVGQGAENRNAAQGDIRVLNRLELPPGRYRLRAAALDVREKRTGSVVYDLDVPDYSRGAMAISGITVTSLAGSTMRTAILDDELKEILPAPFVSRRAFSRSDQLDLFAEVYDNSGKAPHKVDIVTSVLTADGRQVARNEDAHDSTEFKGAKRAFRYTAHLPLTALPPGEYVLSVEVRSRSKKDASAIRYLPFRVLPAGTETPR